MIYVLEFVLTFIVILVIYLILNHFRKKKIRKGEIPGDLRLFVVLNKLPRDSLDYKKLLKHVAIINSFCIALIFVLTELSNNYIIKTVIAIISTFAVIFTVYKLAGKFYKK